MDPVPESIAPRALIFDWDNTLVDSWPCIHVALTETFGAMGHTPWTYEETRARVGLSMRDAFPTLFKERWEEARDIFYAAFRARHLEMLTALDGAEAMLQGLRERGLYLAVVSNKTGAFLRTEVEALGWGGYFGAVVGAGDAPRDKPAPDPVHMALEPSGLAAGPEVWFVGDTGVDLECALATGCRPVLVRPEAPAPGEFTEAPPAAYAKDCLDFMGLLPHV